MKPRGVTFAQVIARKPQHPQPQIQTTPTLAELFQQWTDYPQEEYTIRVDNQLGCRSREPLLKVVSTGRASGRQNIFDSWIQKQSAAQNKENMNRQAGRALIDSRLSKRSNKSNNFSKEDSMNVERSNRSNQHKKPYNAQYLYREIAENQQEKKLIKHPFIPKSINSKSVKQSQSSADLQLARLPHQIDSIRMNALIASTQNIHNQIADLAKSMAKQHQYKLDTQQSEEEQLLIDDSDRKPVKKVKEQETQEEREKRRWMEAKQVVGSYLKNFNKAKIQIVDKSNEEPTVKILAPPATVAYSFASNIEEMRRYQILKEQQLNIISKQIHQPSIQTAASKQQRQALRTLQNKENQQIQKIMQRIQLKPSKPIEMAISIETVLTKNEELQQQESKIAIIKQQTGSKQEEIKKGEEIETIIMRKWQSPPCSTKNDLILPKTEINEFKSPTTIQSNSGRPCSPFKTIKQVKNSITNPPIKVSFTKSQDTAVITTHVRPLRFIKTYASPKSTETSSNTANTYTTSFSNHPKPKIECVSAPNNANHKRPPGNPQPKPGQHTYLPTLVKPIPQQPKQPFSTVPLIASKTMNQSLHNSFESSERFQFDF